MMGNEGDIADLDLIRYGYPSHFKMKITGLEKAQPAVNYPFDKQVKGNFSFHLFQ